MCAGVNRTEACVRKGEACVKGAQQHVMHGFQRAIGFHRSYEIFMDEIDGLKGVYVCEGGSGIGDVSLDGMRKCIHPCTGSQKDPWS